METKVGVRAEWDELKSVVVHTPSSELFYGNLHPDANLYRKNFDSEEATNEHKGFQETLKSNGIKVYTVEDILTKNIDVLKDTAERCLTFIHKTKGKLHTNEKKREYIETMSSKALVSIIIKQPTIYLKDGDNKNSLDEIMHYEIKPLTNLFFLRDQQIITDKGVVLGSMATTQRCEEKYVTELVFNNLNMPPIYKIGSNKKYSDATLEGGDYIPAGDVAYIGQGLRTNASAIKELLENKCLDFPEVAVIHGPQEMDQMHLDTWFNLAGKSLAITRYDTFESVKMDLYRKNVDDEYILDSEKLSFKDFIEKEKKYDVIEITPVEQDNFGTNFLTTRDREIITTCDISNYVSRLEDNLDKVTVLPSPNITSAFGSFHCSCQGIREYAPAYAQKPEVKKVA